MNLIHRLDRFGDDAWVGGIPYCPTAVDCSQDLASRTNLVPTL